MIGATLCATRVLAGIDRYHFAAKDAIAAVLFAANWRFAQPASTTSTRRFRRHRSSTTGPCRSRSSSTSCGRG